MGFCDCWVILETPLVNGDRRAPESRNTGPKIDIGQSTEARIRKIDTPKDGTARIHEVDIEIFVHRGAIGLTGVVNLKPVLGTVGWEGAKDNLVGKRDRVERWLGLSEQLRAFR